ncbi:IPExxxVDY family protein [Niabella ginsengisoli]|uniref:IPExxxVDY family protein n=1 Tax=Niabella ginsengisoli TaxID=522298 RepID=A0ABS9SNK7_9BACT|nr:IPExxxVDY family protein [Niabella ginsengisoli]MCH5599978.1 IPExxxVDY family protein [Niabella ginsengisoli]
MALLKLELDTQEIIDNFFDDTRLLGIVTTVKDYRFCWNLNNMLEINFRINHDIEIGLKRKKDNISFQFMNIMNPTAHFHYLYNNLHDGEFLLPEFKNLDFLWLMKNDTVTEEYLNQIKAMLRNIPGVQLVTELTNEKIKNKEYLIF